MNTPAMGRDVGRQIAEALDLNDIDNIRSIRMDLQADHFAAIEVERYLPTGDTWTVVFSRYQLELIEQVEAELETEDQ